MYAARSAEQVSSMARNILGHAAHASRQGKRDLAGDYGCRRRRLVQRSRASSSAIIRLVATAR